MTHPREHDLALLAGGEAGPVRRFLLDRHVQQCGECREKAIEYRELRDGLANIDLAEVNWKSLAAEMRANIRLGLEAGACVRTTQAPRSRNLRPVIAFACLLLLAGAAELLRDARPHRPAGTDTAPELATTESGIELRTGPSSLTLLKHREPGGVRSERYAANQTVSARGEVSERYIDETGAVTINNVSLQ